jgi:hypothetical protein
MVHAYEYALPARRDGAGSAPSLCEDTRPGARPHPLKQRPGISPGGAMRDRPKFDAFGWLLTAALVALITGFVLLSYRVAVGW